MLQKGKGNIVLISVACIFIIFFWACTFNVIIDDIDNFPEPIIEPLPLSVGVYYSKEFRTYKSVQSNFYGGSEIVDIIDLGGANVAFFNYLLTNTFNNVINLNSFPADSGKSESIDLIIVPSISKFEEYYKGHPDPVYMISIGYKINIHLSNGEYFNSFHIHVRKEPEKKWYGLGRSKGIEAVTMEAMLDLATEFFVNFCSESKINDIFDNICE